MPAHKFIQPVSIRKRNSAGCSRSAKLVLVVVLVAGIVFGWFFFFADFFPALFEGFFGEHGVGDAGVVLILVEENLVDLDAVAFTRDLIWGLNAADGMVVRIVFDFLGAHAGIGVARVHDLAHGEVGAAGDGDAEGAIVAIHQLNPIGFLVVHHVQAAVTENHPRFVDATAENIVYVFLGVFLIGGEVGDGRFGDAAAIEFPPFVAVEDRDDVALGKIFGAIFEWRLGVVLEMSETVEFAGVSELADAPNAGDIMDIQIRRATERVNGLLQDRFGFRGALLGEQDGIVVLREGARRGGEADAGEQERRYDDANDGGASSHAMRVPSLRIPAWRNQPQSTEPPFTLITSPVIKVARSEAAKRMGPAISSAVPTRLSGMGTRADFRPFFVRRTEADISVSTQPGATQFTMML